MTCAAGTFATVLVVAPGDTATTTDPPVPSGAAPTTPAEAEPSMVNPGLERQDRRLTD